MLGVADLVESINQCALLVWLESNVDVDSSASGWVAKTLPVDRDDMPGVLDLHVIPRYDGSGKVGEKRDHEE